MAPTTRLGSASTTFATGRSTPSRPPELAALGWGDSGPRTPPSEHQESNGDSPTSSPAIKTARGPRGLNEAPKESFGAGVRLSSAMLETMALFAIGDVHGCADELEELLQMLPLKDDSTVVMLGDYIDRGPYSRRVIETLIEWKSKHNIITLSGNHEEMLREF